MNRAERRRQERAGKPIGLITETGLYETGDTQNQPLPTKVPGKHRWILTTAYTIPEERLAAAFEGTDTYFDHENRLMLGVGCWDCELPYPEIRPGSVCPAEGFDDA